MKKILLTILVSIISVSWIGTGQQIDSIPDQPIDTLKVYAVPVEIGELIRERNGTKNEVSKARTEYFIKDTLN